MQKNRCVVIIDLANIDFAFKKIKSNNGIGFEEKIDYSKMVSSVIPLGFEVVEKSVYFGTDSSNNLNWKKFVNFFEAIGFRVVSKEMKVIRRDSGETFKKANFDVEIATDLCRYAWRRDCDEVILFSGDSDFAYLIDELKSIGIKVTVVSSVGTISGELSSKADRLILLDDLWAEDLVLK